jgi:hypothetical protein
VTLSDAQALFTELLGELIVWANQQAGFRVRLREVQRTAAQAAENAAEGKGIRDSLHLLSLAGDLLLDIEGVYQEASEAYRPLGERWKSLNPLCRWGGDFHSRPDGNHFSIAWDGRA